MFGISNESAARTVWVEQEAWLIDFTVSNPKTDPRTREFWRRFGGKYLV